MVEILETCSLLRHREDNALMRPAVRGRKNGRKTIGPEGVRNKSKRGKENELENKGACALAVENIFG